MQAFHHAGVTRFEFTLGPDERMTPGFLEPALARIAEIAADMSDAEAARAREWLMALVVYDVVDPYARHRD